MPNIELISDGAGEPLPADVDSGDMLMSSGASVRGVGDSRDIGGAEIEESSVTVGSEANCFHCSEGDGVGLSVVVESWLEAFCIGIGGSTGGATGASRGAIPGTLAMLGDTFS